MQINDLTFQVAPAICGLPAIHPLIIRAVLLAWAVRPDLWALIYQPGVGAGAGGRCSGGGACILQYDYVMAWPGAGGGVIGRRWLVLVVSVGC